MSEFPHSRLMFKMGNWTLYDSYCRGRPQLNYYFCSLCSLKEANFPTQLLPVVVEPGTMVGKLQRSLYGISVGTPVGVGLGDFQCSVLASRSQESDAGNT